MDWRTSRNASSLNWVISWKYKLISVWLKSPTTFRTEMFRDHSATWKWSITSECARFDGANGRIDQFQVGQFGRHSDGSGRKDVELIVTQIQFDQTTERLNFGRETWHVGAAAANEWMVFKSYCRQNIWAIDLKSDCIRSASVPPPIGDNESSLCRE